MRPTVKVKEGNEKLTSHSGLLQIGTLLEALELKERIDNLPGVHCINPTYSHSDVIISMLGLISIGKPDYEAIELFRPNPLFFVDALGISGCPSSATIRQRIDLIGHAAEDILKEESAALIRKMAPKITPLSTSAGDLIPLDIDVSCFDNSKTKKESVSRTYKGFDGFAPIFAYLGAEGYLVNLELRAGSQHCQNNTPQFIRETIAHARHITSRPILMRLDSGNDSQDNFPDVENSKVHFIIKRNLRKESPAAWAQLAKEVGKKIECREGKTVWIGKTMVGVNGQRLPFPIGFEVTERIIKKGQRLAFPDIEVDTYWYSNPIFTPEEVIDLYHDHGTSEQYHSELKSDMDIERLPSGQFSSNSLVLHLGMLSYNMLRIIGQHSLEVIAEVEEDLPLPRRKKVSRRRVRTVMQDFIYMAGRLIKTGRQCFISFGAMNPMARLWTLIDQRLRRITSAIA